MAINELAKEQLYLFELLIDTIVFSEGTVPLKKHVICNCNFESVVSFEIRAEGSGAIEKEERDSKRRDMEFNMGKSYLFSCDPSKLLRSIDTYPLEISVCTRMNPLPYGICVVDWGSEFSDMVQASSESYGYVTPAAIYGLYNLRESTGLPVGSIDLFIRISCFGKNIQTNFQVIHQPGRDGLPSQRQFLFKYTNAGTTFLCERYGMGTSQEVLPIAPIYNSIDIEPVSQFKTIFSNAASRQSVMPFLDFDFLSRGQAGVINTPLMPNLNLDDFLMDVSQTFSDTMSLKFRPHDIKAINIVGLLKELEALDEEMGNVVDDESSGSSFGIDTDVKKTKTKPQAQAKKGAKESIESLTDLTPETINRLLCRNPCCPAAIKFKEYGLGPLARGKCLGCPAIALPKRSEDATDRLLRLRTRNDRSQLIDGKRYNYGLSQASGTMHCYGPYGIHTDEKTGVATLKRVSNATALSQTASQASSRSSNQSMRSAISFVNAKGKGKMRSLNNVRRMEAIMETDGKDSACGCDGTESKASSERQIGDSNLQRSKAPLPLKKDEIKLKSAAGCYRLRGGGPIEQETDDTPSTSTAGGSQDDDDEKTEKTEPQRPPQQPQAQSPPQPFVEMKTLLTEYDHVVEAYRRAVGPCGQATCPFNANVVEAECRKVCGLATNPNYTTAPCTSTSPQANGGSEECVECSARNDVENDDDSLTACGQPQCPYGRFDTRSSVERETRERHVRPACRNARTCPFLKRRQQLAAYHDADDFAMDAIQDADVLPPNCGATSCPFAAYGERERQLPPIHWDCPDPLPARGICRNPNCPLQPSGVKAYNPPVCCVNAIPRPCEDLACPFLQPRTCPYASASNESTDAVVPRPFDVIQSTENCGDSACAFVAETPVRNVSAVRCRPRPVCTTGPPTRIPMPCLPRILPSFECNDPECPLMRPESPPQGSSRSSSSDDAIPPLCRCGPCLEREEEFCPECFRERQRDLCVGLPRPIPPSDAVATEEPQAAAAAAADDDDAELTPCGSATCQAKGGALSCGVCVRTPANESDKEKGEMDGNVKKNKKGKKRTRTSGRTTATNNSNDGAANSSSMALQLSSSQAVAVAKKKFSSLYNYNFGDDYPGVKIGHRHCMARPPPVPHNMGWMWRITDAACSRLRPRCGWQPGAIGRTIASMIREHRAAKGLRMLADTNDPAVQRRGRSRSRKGRVAKKREVPQPPAYEADSESESVSPPATLQIKKKEGALWITMNPLKDRRLSHNDAVAGPSGRLEDLDNDRPYIDCTPIRFRIAKRQRMVDGRQANTQPSPGEASGDFRTCYCNVGEYHRLLDTGEGSSDSSSDIDIDFTPPAGIMRSDRRARAVVHADTQYDEKDFQPAKDGAAGKKKGKKDKDKKKKGKKGAGGKKGKGKKGKK